ncbi:hypothetical protein GZH53_15810 [Flavihumibacter sp. R14]|nr:hypothetical protein [Flavihumibacter soli]
MKPTQPFINMISGFYQLRQKSVTNSDYNKHHNGSISFYVLSEARMESLKVVHQTEPFSDQKMIEISKNAESFIIGDDRNQTEYKRVTPMKLETYEGKSFLHWNVESMNKVQLTVIKLMSPDGCVQLKLMSADRKTQWVYNVCELPN